MLMLHVLCSLTPQNNTDTPKLDLDPARRPFLMSRLRRNATKAEIHRLARSGPPCQLLEARALLRDRIVQNPKSTEHYKQATNPESRTGLTSRKAVLYCSATENKIIDKVRLDKNVWGREIARLPYIISESPLEVI